MNLSGIFHFVAEKRIFLTHAFRYKQFSLLFYTVLMSHANDLQAVSVDEALIDVTTTVNQLRAQAQRGSALQDPVKDVAEKIRAEVRKATTCEGHSFVADSLQGSVTDFAFI